MFNIDSAFKFELEYLNVCFWNAQISFFLKLETIQNFGSIQNFGTIQNFGKIQKLVIFQKQQQKNCPILEQKAILPVVPVGSTPRPRPAGARGRTGGDDGVLGDPKKPFSSESSEVKTRSPLAVGPVD